MYECMYKLYCLLVGFSAGPSFLSWVFSISDIISYIFAEKIIRVAVDM